MPKPFALSLIVIALVVGMGLGFTITPEYAAMRNKETDSMDLGAADRYLDLRFLNAVIAHHQIALDLSKQALDQSHRQEVRTLAEDIIKADEAGITELYRLKKKWYNDTRRVTDYPTINLGENDGKFDLRFLNALIAHHQQAIAMGEEVRTKSTRTEVLNLSDSAITNLSSGLTTLLKWRQDWYGI